MAPPIFHLAFPVHDLEAARSFYGTLLGCSEGRSSDKWIDFNFYGHQIVAHLDPKARTSAAINQVDVALVPISHFGVVLDWEDWHDLTTRLTNKGISFLIEPGIRFAGEVGEQKTFFLRDPSLNTLEFKAFRDSSQLFKRY